MAHWMRPELPQGHDDREVLALLEKVAHEHWLLMPAHGGLPSSARALALRGMGRFLTMKLSGRVWTGRPMVAPFANAVGQTKVWKEGRL